MNLQREIESNEYSSSKKLLEYSLLLEYSRQPYSFTAALQNTPVSND